MNHFDREVSIFDSHFKTLVGGVSAIHGNNIFAANKFLPSYLILFSWLHLLINFIGIYIVNNFVANP